MDEERPVGRRYEGHSGIARDSVWLTHEDLEVRGLKEITATIEEVQIFDRVKFEGGREKTNFLGLKFVKGSRVLGLNATNRKTLNAMFGTDTKAWPGQKVTLYVTKTRRGGEQVDCIRIRERESKAVASAREALEKSPASAPATSPAAGAFRTAAPAAEVDLPDSWTEEQCARFNEACSAMTMEAASRAQLLREQNGSFEGVMRQLNVLADRR